MTPLQRQATDSADLRTHAWGAVKVLGIVVAIALLPTGRADYAACAIGMAILARQHEGG